GAAPRARRKARRGKRPEALPTTLGPVARIMPRARDSPAVVGHPAGGGTEGPAEGASREAA
ncbi:hypothetical protein, partial [Streptomyces scabiei]|uniref:hypothetical protein n=1 Tax=Streptomyces scabiei TaxID=1930 RepID=UPI0029ACCBC4